VCVCVRCVDVSGVEIFTPKYVEAVNGSDVRLKCTFRSTHAISPKTATVSWHFRPLDQGREESVGVPLKLSVGAPGVADGLDTPP